MVPVELDVVAAERAALGRLDLRGGCPEGAQKSAVLAHSVDRHVTHTLGVSGAVAG